MMGDRFLLSSAKELKKVRLRESNSEKALMYPCVILRKESGVTKAKAIRKRIDRRIDHWEKGLLAELVQDTVATARRGVGGGSGTKDDDSIARTYHSIVIGGRLSAAVKMLSNKGGGGVMHPEDVDAKSGRKVIDVLRDKHPDMMILDVEAEGWASLRSTTNATTRFQLIVPRR